MKKNKFTLFISCCIFWSSIYSQNVETLHQNARAFMRQGDYPNAVLVLNRATQLDPKNLEIQKDLGLNYYFTKDYKKALEIYKSILEREDADDQCYQVASDIYIAMDDDKQAKSVLKKGIDKFANSGALYNAYGEMLLNKQDKSAIKQWEKGIEMDPSFSKNFFNASKFYFYNGSKIWSIIYGEIFLNIEPLNTSTAEIKTILLESYKTIFTEMVLKKHIKENNEFIIAVLKTMGKQTDMAEMGINAASLTMIRTRFILNWQKDYATQFPFKLFELQHQLLEEGLFDAYNQWIFTAAQNLPAYQTWINTHTSDYNELTRFQKGRIFKIPVGQYYH